MKQTSKTACGFNFNVLCVGETGLGKSTLLNSLFNDQFEWKTTGGHSNDAVTLKIHTHRLEEASVKLKLMLVETVGYGDQINQEECYSPIVNYVEAQHEAYLQEELKVHRYCILPLQRYPTVICVFEKQWDLLYSTYHFDQCHQEICPAIQYLIKLDFYHVCFYSTVGNVGHIFQVDCCPIVKLLLSECN